MDIVLETLEGKLPCRCQISAQNRCAHRAQATPTFPNLTPIHVQPCVSIIPPGGCPRLTREGTRPPKRKRIGNPATQNRQPVWRSFPTLSCLNPGYGLTVTAV